MADRRQRIPIVIGVTGHRRIDAHDPALAAALAGALAALAARYPNSPFCVVSPLAEGADRLVAREAMDRLGAHLIAILPMPAELYETDFASEASRAEFRELCAQARSIVALPLRSPADLVAKGGEERNRQYALAGAYVVEACQILVAVWDGEASRGSGGTAQVVEWGTTGSIPAAYAAPSAGARHLQRAAPGSVVHISPDGATVRHLGEPAASHRILRRIDLFNRDLGSHLKPGAGGFRLSRRSRPPAGPLGALRERAPGAEPFLSVHESADALALRYQRIDRRVRIGAFALIFFSILSYALIDLWPLAIGIYVVGLPAIGLALFLHRRARIEARHLDYRALAEAARIGAFWCALGIDDRVSRHFLSKHEGVIRWIRQAMQNLELLAAPRAPGADSPRRSPAGTLDLLRRLWIGDQIAFFESRIAPNRRREARCEAAINGFFGLSVLAALALLGLAALFEAGYSGGLLRLGEGLDPALAGYCASAVEALATRLCALVRTRLTFDAVQTAIGLFAAIAVILQIYKANKAFGDLERQYSTALAIFRRAAARLDEPESDLRAVFAELGREAVQEIGEWLWLRRSVGLALPKG